MEVAHLRRELQERETKLAEAKKAEAELIRKQGELEYEKRQLDVQIETRVGSRCLIFGTKPSRKRRMR